MVMSERPTGMGWKRMGLGDTSICGALERMEAFSHLPACAGVVVAAFVGDELSFIHAKDVIAGVCRMLGVTPEQLAERHGTGESRTAVSSPPLLLPGPKN